MEQETIGNVSSSIKNLIFFLISYIFDTSKCATNYIISFEVEHDGFIGVINFPDFINVKRINYQKNLYNKFKT